MNCWHCERPAAGVCRFCGRGLCREHPVSRAAVQTVYTAADGGRKALVIDGVLHCGVCEPQGEPVDLPELG